MAAPASAGLRGRLPTCVLRIRVPATCGSLVYAVAVGDPTRRPRDAHTGCGDRNHGVEFHLYLPQMRLQPQQLVERARAAEAAGFDGIKGMDHLAPPGAPGMPMLAAMPA